MKLTLPLLMVAVSLALGGCAKEQESLHEDDHEVPGHWPSSMQEAADFIETRVNQLSAAVESTDASLDAAGRTKMESELAELVEWTPEVAASTELAEADWIPVYQLSESIRKDWRGGIDLPKIAPQLAKLCELLRSSHAGLSTKPSHKNPPKKNPPHKNDE